MRAALSLVRKTVSAEDDEGHHGFGTCHTVNFGRRPRLPGVSEIELTSLGAGHSGKSIATFYCQIVAGSEQGRCLVVR